MISRAPVRTIRISSCRGAARKRRSARISFGSTPPRSGCDVILGAPTRCPRCARSAEAVNPVLDVRGLRYDLQDRALLDDVPRAVGRFTLPVLARAWSRIEVDP